MIPSDQSATSGKRRAKPLLSSHHGHSTAESINIMTTAIGTKSQEMESPSILASWRRIANSSQLNQNALSTSHPLTDLNLDSQRLVSNASSRSPYILWTHGQITAKFSKQVMCATPTRLMTPVFSLPVVIFQWSKENASWRTTKRTFASNTAQKKAASKKISQKGWRWQLLLLYSVWPRYSTELYFPKTSSYI